jgi:hypothetical protein
MILGMDHRIQQGMCALVCLMYFRAIKGWIESPGHFKNMMGDYEHMGSAYCKGRGGKIFWAQEVWSTFWFYTVVWTR